MRRTTVLAGLVLAASCILAPTASGDGLPVLGIDVGSEGVAAPDAEAAVRYVTLPVPGKTIVARVATDSGRVQSYRLLRGSYTIPAVAYDGSAGGLSADGKTLVLIQPRARFPRARTPLAILDPKNLRARARITLSGDYSFDAISPHGASLYLIHYTSPRDPNRYEVRAYDLRAGRLLPQPVVDPTERGEAMRGRPITRAASSDGRWAYTLYDGAGKEPFVHALDTQQRTARCIDLEMLAGRQDLFNLRLALDSSETLTVRSQSERLALIDTATFAVRVPAPAAVASTPPARPGDGFPWLPAGAACLLVAAAATTLVGLRRRRVPVTS